MSATVRPEIRPARLDEVAALAQLKLATYRETFVEEFAIPYPERDVAAFTADAYGEARVRAELQDPARETWVAPGEAGDLLGYVHIGPCRLPHPEARSGDGEIHQLYVRRTAQRLGTGRRLFSLALERLGQRYPGPVWLGVWSGNARAQAIYQARGFKLVGDYQFAVGDWRDEEYIMRLDR